MDLNNIDMDMVSKLMQNVDINQLMGMLQNSNLGAMGNIINGAGNTSAGTISMGAPGSDIYNMIEEGKMIFGIMNMLMSKMGGANLGGNFQKYKGIIIIGILYVMMNPNILGANNILGGNRNYKTI